MVLLAENVDVLIHDSALHTDEFVLRFLSKLDELQVFNSQLKDGVQRECQSRFYRRGG